MAITDAPVILEARALSRAFHLSQGLLGAPKTLVAVDGVSLSLQAGDVLGIVGESGCGKSTLARLLLGLIAPSAGEARIDGRPISSLDARERARLVQPVFQDPYSSLNPRRRVRDIVALPLTARGGLGHRAIDARVRAMLDRVGLSPDLAERYPVQLSGGQRQRVAIARALVAEPKIVVCDEPTSALDVSVQAQILNLLDDLRRDLGLSLILISHNLAVVEHLANRVAVMYLGRIVEEAAVDDLFGAPKHPYTQALLASVLTPEPGRGIPDVGLGDIMPDPSAVPPGCRFHPRCLKVFEPCRSEAPRPLAVSGGTVECHLFDEAVTSRSTGRTAAARPGRV
jgi:peptide/nickel transport system ATP-binding protein